MRGKRFSRYVFWWASLVLGLALATFFFWEPAAAPIVCLFRRLVSLPCPGCGLTRAASHLVHGELLTSVRMHPFALLFGAEAVILWVVAGVRVHRGLPIGLPDGIHVWALGHGGAMLVLWLGRLATGTTPF